MIGESSSSPGTVGVGARIGVDSRWARFQVHTGSFSSDCESFLWAVGCREIAFLAHGALKTWITQATRRTRHRSTSTVGISAVESDWE